MSYICLLYTSYDSVLRWSPLEGYGFSSHSTVSLEERLEAPLGATITLPNDR